MPEGGLIGSASLMKSTMQEAQNDMKRMTALLSRDYGRADYSCEVILKRIKEFEDNLDTEHEVAIMLASFGQSITLTVTKISYSNPSTLVFYGYVGDQPATLIQHMSQLNFLLLAVKKAVPEEPPRRIGFVAPTEG